MTNNTKDAIEKIEDRIEKCTITGKDSYMYNPDIIAFLNELKAILEQGEGK